MLEVWQMHSRDGARAKGEARTLQLLDQVMIRFSDRTWQWMLERRHML